MILFFPFSSILFICICFVCSFVCLLVYDLSINDSTFLLRDFFVYCTFNSRFRFVDHSCLFVRSFDTIEREKKKARHGTIHFIYTNLCESFHPFSPPPCIKTRFKRVIAKWLRVSYHPPPLPAPSNDGNIGTSPSS